MNLVRSTPSFVRAIQSSLKKVAPTKRDEGDKRVVPALEEKLPALTWHRSIALGYRGAGRNAVGAQDKLRQRDRRSMPQRGIGS